MTHADPAGPLDHWEPIPFPERQWDLVATTAAGGSLWVGGHQTASGEPCLPGSEFDAVYSLYARFGSEPDVGVAHYIHFMPDGPLSRADSTTVSLMASEVAHDVLGGSKVLVRCHAGINRSVLVAVLALAEMGIEPDAAIGHLRVVRSPWALSNAAFEMFARQFGASTPDQGAATLGREVPKDGEPGRG